MANLKKKTELVKLLKKLDNNDFVEAGIIDEIIQELELIKESIPDQQDLSPYFRDVSVLKIEQSALVKSIDTLNSALKLATQEISSNTILVNGKIDEIAKTVKDSLKNVADDLRAFDILLASRGGGSAHRKLLNNGTEIATKYADINFIGSGITITTADDNTKKVTTVTLTVSGGSFSVMIPTGALGQGVFVFTTAPSVIVRDGTAMVKVSKDGTINWTGTTTVTLSVWPNNDVFGY